MPDGPASEYLAGSRNRTAQGRPTQPNPKAVLTSPCSAAVLPWSRVERAHDACYLGSTTVESFATTRIARRCTDTATPRERCFFPLKPHTARTHAPTPSPLLPTLPPKSKFQVRSRQRARGDQRSTPRRARILLLHGELAPSLARLSASGCVHI